MSRVVVKQKVIKSLDELSCIDLSLPVFSDIETADFYVDCRTIQVYQPQTMECAYIIDTDVLDYEEAKKLMKPMHTVWWGGNYDLGTLNIVTAKVDDLQWAARIAYPEWRKMKLEKGKKPFALDVAIMRMGYDYLYDGLDKKAMQKASFLKGVYLSQSQLRYAATDVYALSLMWNDPKMQAAMQKMAYKVDILSLKYAVQYQQNGILVDMDSVNRELALVEPKIKANQEILGDLNCNSTKQVPEYFGTENGNKNTMIKLISEGGERGRMAKAVYDQRRLLKRRTMLQSYKYKKVQTKFNPNGAVTSRFSATGGALENGINSQQITRDLQYIMNQDTEDTVVIHADYSTAELRAGASIMQDATMYQELKDDIDLHVEAAILAGVPRESMVKANADFKENRQKGKSVSFGKIFGQSPPSFIEYAYVNYGVIFTLAESKELHAKYKHKYKGVAKYHSARWNDYKKVPVVSPLGHRNMANLGTDAINFATQAAVAETTKLALHYLCKEFPEALKYIYNVVHDAIYLRVPKGQEELWVPRLGKAMARGWTELCKTPLMYYKDIPMPIEIEYLDKVVVFRG